MPCTYGQNIPGIFTLWNRALEEGWLPLDPHVRSFAKNGRRFLRAYSRVNPGYRQGLRCIGCGRCRCPQGIGIPALLRKIDGFVESLRRTCYV